MTRLDVLFVHNNFPAQYRNIARKLGTMPGFRLAAIGAHTAPGMPNVDLRRYSIGQVQLGNSHPFARRFEIESHRAEQVIYAANLLKMDGFAPRLIYAHPGWGESLPLRVLFPDARLCSFAEFYYAAHGTDVGFDPEFAQFGIDGQTRVVLRNATSALAMIDADFAIAPTAWQRSVFPREFQGKIHVIHDGLDTERLQPGGAGRALAIAGQAIAAEDEVVTYVSRNLEPYRGFHVFMRALPEILAARPRARIFIMGGDRVSYGVMPTRHESWRSAMLEEVGSRIDLNRVHFLGSVPYEEYLGLLGRSDAHVYFTYPFVLSWSMLEAMACECLVIGSNTPPVAEVIRHAENGLLVPFFDVSRLAHAVIEVLASPQRFQALRKAARQTIVANYDFETVCWPRHFRLLSQALGLPA